MKFFLLTTSVKSELGHSFKLERELRTFTLRIFKDTKPKVMLRGMFMLEMRPFCPKVFIAMMYPTTDAYRTFRASGLHDL